MRVGVRVDIEVGIRFGFMASPTHGTFEVLESTSWVFIKTFWGHNFCLPSPKSKIVSKSKITSTDPISLERIAVFLWTVIFDITCEKWSFVLTTTTRTS